MSAKAARFVLARLWRQPRLKLALPTGATPLGLYKNLVKMGKTGQVNFKNIISFNLDEYWALPASDPGSYRYFMGQHLFRALKLKDGQTRLPDGCAHDANKAGRDYEKAIKQAGGLDLAILGIGTNGHIGFNEPGTPFDSRTHLTKLAAETRRANAKHFHGRPTPTHAITMGLGTIMEAKKILLLASGMNKARALADAIEGKVTTSLPASILQWHPDVTVIIDGKAAADLKYNYRSPLLFTEGDIELLGKNDLPAGKKAIVISPHPDDASISLGGTLAALTKNNHVFIAIMTSGYRGALDGHKREEIIKIRENEAKIEAKILGCRTILLRADFYDARDQERALRLDIGKTAQIFKKIKPDMIFLPNAKDRHPTHCLSRQTALAALDRYQKDGGKTVQLWEFEGPWSMFSEGDFNAIFAYDEKIMNKKMAAISSQTSQINRTRFDVAAKALARLRATVVPEQALVGYGAKPPRLGKYFELFAVGSR